MTTALTSTLAPGAAGLSRAPAARAADGDFATKGAGHTVRDADGDYKPDAAVGPSAASPPVKVSAPVQQALAALVKGG